ncbi:Putative N-acetyl-LL-diaminopimelate aminotransferase [Aquisphaera giovannonii]|uniref:Aminotransferase n=1 Tax=Aquisphaera giovannonii TaxID=406548 RepID=A0A5B9W5K9_9BACT|nr:aminotransferase class I/II-fold pyridoxal phosphate-dependent enzyme [Aquisphaera giovannonii]QEH35405.1 Putative N-acetyl-LL-diaminopimelate aminotransferase [Aquisphaera giovannonii]
MNDAWLADRMTQIDASGIRKAFEMARAMKDPIDLSIGMPYFDVDDAIKDAAFDAIREGRNQYSVTLGIPELREAIRGSFAGLGHADRDVIVTAGTAGAMLLALIATVNPGDEVIVFDPYFVMYRHQATMAGGVTVVVDTYPDFRIDPAKVAAAMTPRTKAVIVNSPNNPTGVVASTEDMRALALLCKERGILLISDEVYRSLCFDGEARSPAEWNEDVLVVDGFSKALGMTGWRLGYAHGPSRLIQEMAKLQQFTFVCAPTPLQFGVARVLAGGKALDSSSQVEAYSRKRDMVVEALSGLYELTRPAGAFYVFPKAPRGTASEFCAEAIRRELLVIPGNVFSRRDTHFRISYATSDDTLKRGLDVLRSLA